MNAQELMQVMDAEGLDAPLLDGDRPGRDRAVVLEKVGDGWRAYLTNERGGIMESTLRAFDVESDAFEYVLLKLRQGAKYRRLRAARQPSGEPRRTEMQRQSIDGR